MQDHVSYISEQIDPESDERKGKQSTNADSTDSPRRILRQPGRSNHKEEAARAQQGPSVPKESVRAGYNRGEGVRTSFVSRAHEHAEQERLLLESTL